ncbi:hypothetical protein Tco_1068693 [Tanacetum coccineum]|uniref:Uncharacterized protein n=1 Tax=Tanacetum coccineum TaxID=301880 RepID=A0ABQ5HGL6_9ASTR
MSASFPHRVWGRGEFRLLACLDALEVHRKDYWFIRHTGCPDQTVREPSCVEQDTQDIYVVIEDGQDKQTQLFQRVDGLAEDGQFHYETARLLWGWFSGFSLQREQLSAALGHIQALQARDQTHADDPEGAVNVCDVIDEIFTCLYRCYYRTKCRQKILSLATYKAAAVATPMTAAAVKQLIKARVTAALANH